MKSDPKNISEKRSVSLPRYMWVWLEEQAAKRPTPKVSPVLQEIVLEKMGRKARKGKAE